MTTLPVRSNPTESRLKHIISHQAMSSSPRRNDPCPCGSGRKYKQCCQDEVSWRDNSLVMGVGVALLLVLGLVLASMAFSRLGGGEAPPDCPPGQVWSEAHGHCH